MFIANLLQIISEKISLSVFELIKENEKIQLILEKSNKEGLKGRCSEHQ
jgi:hypothetical protein